MLYHGCLKSDAAGMYFTYLGLCAKCVIILTDTSRCLKIGHGCITILLYLYDTALPQYPVMFMADQRTLVRVIIENMAKEQIFFYNKVTQPTCEAV